MPSGPLTDEINPYRNWTAFIDYVIKRDNPETYTVQITDIVAYPAIEPVTYWHAERHVE